MAISGAHVRRRHSSGWNAGWWHVYVLRPASEQVHTLQKPVEPGDPPPCPLLTPPTTPPQVADSFHAPNEQPELAAALQARAGSADLCKACVEADRCQAAREGGYAAGLFKVLGWQDMAKNDLLVGLPGGEGSAARWGSCWALLQPPMMDSAAAVPTGGN